MFSFFPTPYPDELFYSIITRYHIRSGNRNFQQTLFELLGYASQQLCNLELPNNLIFLAKHLPIASRYSVQSFICNNTLYPFYKSFLTQPEAFLLKEMLAKKANKPILRIAKISINEKRETRQFLNFCRQCLEQDIQRYGEAYWHCLHQVPGVLVCPIHSLILQKSLVLFKEGYLDCHAADLENCSIELGEASCREDTLQQLLAVAEDIIWLSSSDFSFKGLQWLRSRYQYYLVEKEFGKILPSKAFKFDSQKFVDAIFSFYSQEYWNIVKPSTYTHAEQYFTHCLLACDIMPTIDRVTHISLIRFLSNSLKEFFKG